MGKISVTGISTGNVVEDAANNVVGGDLNVRGGPDLFVAVDYIQGKYGHFTIALDGVCSALPTVSADCSREMPKR